MNLSVLAITFGLIFVAELPDKTMIATIVMASRYRPLPVWIGAAEAMVVNAAGGVPPRRWVEAVVPALFAAGSLSLLLVKESAEEHEGDEEADQLRSGRRVAL